MGYLTTFSLADADSDAIKASRRKLLDALFMNYVEGAKTDVDGMEMTILPHTHADNNVVYVQHDGMLHDLHFKSSSEVKSVAQSEWRRMSTTFKMKDTRPEPYAKSLREALCVATIHLDSLDRIMARPNHFAQCLASAFEYALNNHEKPYTFGGTVVQMPLMRDADALYICAGNTTVWFDSRSPEVARLKAEFGGFHRELRQTLARYAR